MKAVVIIPTTGDNKVLRAIKSVENQTYENTSYLLVVDGNKLSCCMTQRSMDCACGEPFNICSYSMLCCLIAKHCDLEPYEFIHYAGNCHIYADHLDNVKEQIKRTPYDFPTLEILNKRENINDYVVDDFKISNYQHHPQIKAAMRA